MAIKGAGMLKKSSPRSAQQLINKPPVALGRPPRSFRTGQELLHALAPGLFKLFRRRLVIAKFRSQLRTDSRRRHSVHNKGPLDQSLANQYRLARPHRVGSLCRLAIHRNATCTAGVGGQRTRFENADRPEPFVHAFRFECGNHSRRCSDSQYGGQELCLGF
jgi:hypothetical protein